MRLLPVGRQRLPKLDLDKEPDLSIPLPWCPDQPAALLELCPDTPGQITVTCVADSADAVLWIHRPQAAGQQKRTALEAAEQLELGVCETLWVGCKLEVASPEDAERAAQSGKLPGSHVYMLTAFKTPQRRQAIAGTPMALTSGTLSVPRLDHYSTPMAQPTPGSAGTVGGLTPSKRGAGEVQSPEAGTGGAGERCEQSAGDTAVEAQQAKRSRVEVPGGSAQQGRDAGMEAGAAAAAQQAQQEDGVAEGRPGNQDSPQATEELAGGMETEPAAQQPEEGEAAGCGEVAAAGGTLAGTRDAAAAPAAAALAFAATQAVEWEDVMEEDEVLASPAEGSPAKFALPATQAVDQLAIAAELQALLGAPPVPMEGQGSEEGKGTAQQEQREQQEQPAGSRKEAKHEGAAQSAGGSAADPSTTEQVPTAVTVQQMEQQPAEDAAAAAEEQQAQPFRPKHEPEAEQEAAPPAAAAAAPAVKAESAPELPPNAELAQAQPGAGIALPVLPQGDDPVSFTVRECSNILRQVRDVLFDQGGSSAAGSSSGSGCSLATASRAAAWAHDLDGMQAQCAMPPVVVGVVGDTGTGKSSMLNALLGEEEVLPQSGMRACTACVIEVSHQPSALYSGEVEFVTEEEWLATVETLWNDLQDEDGNLKLQRDPLRNVDAGTPHGSAQVMLESVLGRAVVRSRNVTKDQLLRTSNQVTRYLGRLLKVQERDARAFKRQISQYVDGRNKRDELSPWPLVRVCRIRHNWEVLSSGAMLVDLPGVRDANAARGRVAESYLKKCSAVWVVADITRAVDNKTAKDLLGEGFRRQMMLDGQFGAISFICTKTDNITAREIVEGMGAAEICARTDMPLKEFLELDEALEQKRKDEEEKGKEFRSALGAVKRVLKKTGKLSGRLEVVNEALAAKEGAGASEDEEEGPGGAGAAEEAGSSGDEDAIEAGSDEGSDSEEPDAEMEDAEDSGEDDDDDVDEKSLKKVQQEGHKEGRRAAKKAKLGGWSVERLREERGGISAQLRDLREQRNVAEATKKKARRDLDALKRELAKLQVSLNSVCGRARNSYSKEEIKKDFREGIKAVEEGAGGDERVQQLDDLELPVFSISARDAQKLERRCKKDGPVSAYKRLEHTEIPDLREHIKDIARRGRIHAARRLASSLLGFAVGTALLLRDQEATKTEVGSSVKKAFESHEQELAKQLASTVEEWGRELEAMVLSEGLSPRLSSGAQRAEQGATRTAAKWGDKPPVGYFWATYKATCRRQGEYTSGARGEINFNNRLADPILDGMAVAWDALFGTKLAGHLRAFKQSMVGVVSSALEALCSEVVPLGLDPARLQRLREQVLADVARRVQEGVDVLLGDAGEQQRTLSREIISPTVKAHMSTAYQLCVDERGTGSFARMKMHMLQQVEAEKRVMFQDATGRMEQELGQLVGGLVEGVRHIADRLLQRLATHFSVLWERPPSNTAQRAAAVAALTLLARKLEAVCRQAGVAASAMADLEPLLRQPSPPRRPPPTNPASPTAAQVLSSCHPGLSLAYMPQDLADISAAQSMRTEEYKRYMQARYGSLPLSNDLEEDEEEGEEEEGEEEEGEDEEEEGEEEEGDGSGVEALEGVEEAQADEDAEDAEEEEEEEEEMDIEEKQQEQEAAKQELKPQTAAPQALADIVALNRISRQVASSMQQVFGDLRLPLPPSGLTLPLGPLPPFPGMSQGLPVAAPGGAAARPGLSQGMPAATLSSALPGQHQVQQGRASESTPWLWESLAPCGKQPATRGAGAAAAAAAAGTAPAEGPGAAKEEGTAVAVGVVGGGAGSRAGQLPGPAGEAGHAQQGGAARGSPAGREKEEPRAGARSKESVGASPCATAGACVTASPRPSPAAAPPVAPSPAPGPKPSPKVPPAVKQGSSRGPEVINLVGGAGGSSAWAGVRVKQEPGMGMGPGSRPIPARHRSRSRRVSSGGAAKEPPVVISLLSDDEK